ncbi:MAG: hypothetical protein FWF29_13000, partial [Treponema sp.]|nr:hypothetical protein [Treponema sp.]
MKLEGKVMKKLFVLCALFSVLCAPVARADDFGVQDAWDNPEANMSAGSIKPGFAQLTWSPGV